MTDTVELIADHFQAYLLVEIGLGNAREADRLNRTAAYNSCCASHNFCDANMSMAAGFEAVMDREPDVGSEEDCALWNAAWEVARSRGFARVDDHV